MDIARLKVLLQCPKCYELESVISHRKEQRNRVMQKAYTFLVSALKKQEVWSDCSRELEQLLRFSFPDDWYEIPWLKGREIKELLQKLERVYLWLKDYLSNTFEENVRLCISCINEIEGHKIEEIDVNFHILVEADGKVTGILLCERLPECLRGRSRGKQASQELEIMIPMMALQQEYPQSEIEIVMISLASRKDTIEMLAEFEELQDDNVIKFSGELLLRENVMDTNEQVKRLINGVQKRGCANCIMRELCFAPAPKRCISEEKKITSEEKQYTQAQKQAISHGSGPLCVVAGPGSGKTEVLTARIEHLIREGIPANKILALTFTKKAAKEVLNRVASEKKPRVTTLHALGYHIIRESKSLIGKKKLVNRVDCMKLLMQVLKEAPRLSGADYKRLSGRQGLLHLLLRDFSYIDRHGTEDFLAKFPKKDSEKILLIKNMYDERYRSASYIMYDEQISLAVYILENYPNMRKRIQDSFQYILVDEVQDLDIIQARLIELLVSQKYPNIAIYGDSDQVIYGFRGSSNRFMLGFCSKYDRTKKIHLSDNFRSSKEILLPANQLISHNRERMCFSSRSRKMEAGYIPKLLKDFHVNQLCKFVNDMKKQGYMLGDIAILARTNRELRSICTMLDVYNASCKKEDRIAFEQPKYYLYQDYTFCVLLDLLAIHQGKYIDDMVLYRLLRACGIIPKKENPELSLYENYLQYEHIFPFDTAEETRYLNVGDKDTVILQAFAKIFRAKQCFNQPAAEAVKSAARFFCREGIDNVDVLETIGDLIYERSIYHANELWEYMAAMRKYEDNTRVSYQSGSADSLPLLTAHDSKGKEFKVVLIYGIDSFESNDIEEDRRLLYVAMTRAKERLFLTEICNGKSMLLPEFQEKLEVLEGNFYA